MDLMMEDIEEVILALKAAGYAMPQYEILPDGAVHYFYGTKEENSLFIASNPGVLTEEITLGIKRASLGLHLRNLTDKGLLVKTQDNRWQVSNNYVMEKTVHKLTPMDVADKYIREMIFCSGN